MKNKLYLLAFPTTIALAISVLVTEYFWLNYYLTDKELYLTNSSIAILIALFLISYYRSITISNKHFVEQAVMPKRRINRSPYNHKFYDNNNICEKDNNKFRPVRAEHCDICGCQLRMDNHCLWINNCVGLRNHRAFFLFCIYAASIVLHYIYRSISYYLYWTNLNRIPKHPLEFTIFWTILNIIAVFFAINLLSLTIMQFNLIALNMTTIDLKKGIYSPKIDRYRPNIFHLTGYQNIAMLFQYDAFTFWLPLQRITDNDGTEYPTVPPVTNEQVADLNQDLQQSLKTQSQKQLPKTLKQLHEKYGQQYKNSVFQYLDEQYRLDEQDQIKNEKMQIQKQKRSEQDNKLIEQLYG